MIWAYSPEGNRAVSLPKQATMSTLTTSGLKIGMLDNRKANAGMLLAELGARLEQRLGASVQHYTKPNASVAARPELLDRIAADSELAVVASSD